MKKTFFIVALFIGVLLFAGGYADSRYRTALGHAAPALSVGRADSMITLDRMRGRYVLLNFWSSTDAASRQAVNEYRAWKRRNPDVGLELVGVNFDESEKLFREIVRLDSLCPADQYHVAGDTARAIVDNYGLDNGYGSVLISPEGRIIAINPSDTELAGLLPGCP